MPTPPAAHTVHGIGRRYAFGAGGGAITANGGASGFFVAGSSSRTTRSFSPSRSIVSAEAVPAFASTLNSCAPGSSSIERPSIVCALPSTTSFASFTAAPSLTTSTTTVGVRVSTSFSQPAQSARRVLGHASSRQVWSEARASWK